MQKNHLDGSGSCTDVANKGFLEDTHVSILISYPCVLYLILEMNVADRMTVDHPTFNKEKPWVTTGPLSSHDMKGSHDMTWGRTKV